MFADAGYQGAENREELADVKAQWAIAMRPGRLKELNKHPRQGGAPVSDHQTSVWLCEGAVKGLRKNDNQLAMLFTLANLFRVDQMIRAWDSCAQKSR